MKRSEAITKIILWAMENDRITFLPIETQWERTLNFLEKEIGMLPPKTYLGNFDHDGCEIFEHGWEKEE